MTIITAVLLLLFCMLGVRAVGRPAAAATAFGLPDAPGNYVRVYGSRNLALALAAGALLALGDARALAVLLTAAAALPLFDMAMLRAVAVRHVMALVVLSSAAGLWWTR
jgi:hypothetical protein